jgi:iron complex outermembrane receptor protein
MNQTLAYILLFWGLSVNSLAQMAMDTIRLPEVKLEHNRLQTHSIGTDIEVLSPDLIGESSSQQLSDCIANHSSVYIKKYGALATPTFRGTSSSHTLVLWNGIPLNSIANGLLDFSITPIHGFEKIAIVHGGDASVFGSGAIGGSIHLNSIPVFMNQKEIKLTREQGSYGLLSQGISLKHSKAKLAFNLSLTSLMDENSFTYTNTTQRGHPTVANDYGKIESKSGKLNLAYRYDSTTKFAAAYWSLANVREVPQNMTTPFSDAIQYDKSNNLLLSTTHFFGDGVITFKRAFLEEDFRYTEQLKNIDSQYLANSNIMDMDVKINKGRFLYNLGGNITKQSVINNNYMDTRYFEKQGAIFSSLQYNYDFLSMITVLRKQWQTTFAVPLIASLAFSADLTKQLIIRFKYNRNFRSPTFNDRFWAGAGANGNPDLTPEDACNKEFGFDINTAYFKFKATAYNLDISDMILWQQMDNGSWIPNNIKQVWSRGLETRLKVQTKNISLIGNYAFTKSTNEITTDPLDISVGKQLRYVPLHKGGVTFILKEGDLIFTIDQNYTGQVITSYGTLENKFLPDFILTNITISYSPDYIPVSIKGEVKNLMNKSYTTYQNYPNPGRELLLTLTCIIN